MLRYDAVEVTGKRLGRKQDRRLLNIIVRIWTDNFNMSL